jgi:hypothetical protein
VNTSIKRMNTTVPGSHLSAIPPSTRSVLGSSTSSTKSTPSSPISTSSTSGGTTPLSSNSTAGASGSGRNERNLNESIQTVRPGTSLTNMNVSSSSTSTDAAGTTKTALKLTEHLRSHEHHTYSTGDDLDEFNSPGASNNSLNYRQYQQHTGAYGSPRAATGAQLRANRAAATGASVFGVNQLDLFSPGGGVGALHSLHSKGSNLSTNTFIAGPSRDREKERPEREPLPTSSNTTPGTVTPTASNTAPFTSTQQPHQGQPPSTPVPMAPTHPAVGRSKPSAPNTPVTNAASLPHTPQSTLSPSGSIPSGMTAPSHPAVTRTKSSLSSTANNSAPLPNSHRSGGSRRGTTARERDREGGDGSTSRRAKLRNTPHLPSGPPMEMAGPTLMYWSRAPVYGHLPTRSMRAHSVTLVDNTAWLFGGCDERGCARDVWCCDVGESHWFSFF